MARLAGGVALQAAIVASLGTWFAASLAAAHPPRERAVHVIQKFVDAWKISNGDEPEPSNVRTINTLRDSEVGLIRMYRWKHMSFGISARGNVVRFLSTSDHPGSCLWSQVPPQPTRTIRDALARSGAVVNPTQLRAGPGRASDEGEKLRLDFADAGTNDADLLAFRNTYSLEISRGGCLMSLRSTDLVLQVKAAARIPQADALRAINAHLSSGGVQAQRVALELRQVDGRFRVVWVPYDVSMEDIAVSTNAVVDAKSGTILGRAKRNRPSFANNKDDF